VNARHVIERGIGQLGLRTIYSAAMLTSLPGEGRTGSARRHQDIRARRRSGSFSSVAPRLGAGRRRRQAVRSARRRSVNTRSVLRFRCAASLAYLRQSEPDRGGRDFYGSAVRLISDLKRGNSRVVRGQASRLAGALSPPPGFSRRYVVPKLLRSARVIQRRVEMLVSSGRQSRREASTSPFAMAPLRTLALAPQKIGEFAVVAVRIRRVSGNAGRAHAPQ